MSEQGIELRVYDKVFSFHRVAGEWEAIQPITGPTMTPIFCAALDEISTLRTENKKYGDLMKYLKILANYPCNSGRNGCANTSSNRLEYCWPCRISAALSEQEKEDE